jgi:hypothetical protein
MPVFVFIESEIALRIGRQIQRRSLQLRVWEWQQSKLSGDNSPPRYSDAAAPLRASRAFLRSTFFFKL